MSTQLQNVRSRFEQDGELLQQFVRQGSQEAFAAIMRRHLPFVYAACHRELCSVEAAQDATQAVFLILARKAATLRNGTVLAAWLFQTARFVSQDLRKKEQRRMLHEQRVLQNAVPLGSNHETLWNRMEPLLNEMLTRLNHVERDAILLRYIDGMTLQETGAALGMTEGAARMRISRALEKMRRHLEKAGVVLSVTVLAALLEESSTRAASQVPVTLNALMQEQASHSILQMLAAPRPAQLAHGVEQTMKMISLKTTVVIAVSASVIFGAVSLVHSHTRPHRAALTGARMSAKPPAAHGRQDPSVRTDLVVPDALANLTLPNNCTLTFAVTIRDVRSPAIRADLEDVNRRGVEDAVKQGRMTPQMGKEVIARMVKSFEDHPRVVRFNAVLSVRDGKMVFRRDQFTPSVPGSVMTLPEAFVYDGANSLTLMPGGEAEVHQGMYLAETMNLIPMPGVGLPFLPLFKTTPEETPSLKPIEGWAAALPGAVPFLNIRPSGQAPAGPPYFPGELRVSWVNGAPQALEARTYHIFEKTSDVDFKLLLAQAEFSEHQRFQGVWLAGRTSYTEYSHLGGPDNVTEFVLKSADPNPLPDNYFATENYLNGPNTVIHFDKDGRTIIFPYDPQQGSLQAQIQAHPR